MKNILVTGGAGYIGSHTVIELVKADYSPIVIDNFSNSNPEVFNRLEQILDKNIPFYEADVSDKGALSKIFDEHQIDAVIHFAGLKAVGESVSKPLSYYRTNLDSTLSLCEAMQEHRVKKLVFSSSATVYGDPVKIPIDESELVKPTNPYGQTKAMIEQILNDLARANENWQISLLRYFNPIGADRSGLIGEDPKDIPNNLLPYVSQVAVGKLKQLSVFGNDYDTPDGTGVRDYIHVTDLAKGHIAALNNLPEPNSAEAYNLGTGKGVSVLEIVKAFEKASGKKIPYQVVDRRPGDIATCYSDPKKANQMLNWKAELALDEACADSWRWQSQNPNGYKQ